MSNSRTWAFEDLYEGLTIDLGQKLVDREEIIEFASEFDPQPFHLDEAAGKTSILGGLAASGWHTCSMFMRMLCDGFLLASTSQGGPGIEYVRWRRPVIAGDTLSGTVTIESVRLSRSRPTLGLAVLAGRLENQRGEVAMEMKHTGMFTTRGSP